MMRSMRWLIVFLLLAVKVYGQEMYPVIPGDFPDPSIIKQGDQYFAIGTSSEWAPHFPIFRSTDLKSWKQTGYLFDKAPEWTSASFWAPEYFYHNKTYYVYYTARRKSDNVSCIGVATSKYPDRGFTDHGILIAYGTEAIDAFVFDDGGQLYISWKAYGLDKRPIEILGSKLSSDGLRLEGAPFSMLKDTNGVGIEGQSILKRNGFYYLFYSAGACCGMRCDYNVRVARARHITGPYEDAPENPIMKGNSDWTCTGHGTFVAGPDNAHYYLYHAYNRSSMVRTGRQGMLAKLLWNQTTQWPALQEISGGPYPSGIKDDFSGNSYALQWQWDFRHATPVIKQQHGRLLLSGSYASENKVGVVITRRPVLPQYQMEVSVENKNEARKGLVIYGDVKNAIGLSVVADSVIYWAVKDGEAFVLAASKVAAGAIRLKMVVSDSLEVFYRSESGSWQAVAPSRQVSFQELSPWDRSARPGLHFSGNKDDKAVFGDFSLSYP